MAGTDPILGHYTTGRSVKNMATLLAIVVALIIAKIWIDLALGWVIFLLLFCLPLAWDLATDRRTMFEIYPEGLYWSRANADAQVPASEIAHVDLKLRLDRSVKLQVRLQSGEVITAPPETLPKADPLEAGLREAGYDVRRHPFALI